GSKGGGMWCDYTNATISHSSVDNNAGDEGGGFWIADATWHVHNTSFTGNTATQTGGGLHVETASLVMRHVAVRGNRASQGGGISHMLLSSVTLLESTVSDNVAASEGGGLFTEDGATVLSAATSVANNTAEGGGGLDVHQGSLAVDAASEVAGNVASEGGGARLVAAKATLDGGSRIAGCRSMYGGGVLSIGGVLTISGNTSMVSNRANIGGGVLVRGGGLVAMLGGCSLQENFAETFGGGLYAEGSAGRAATGELSVDNSTLTIRGTRVVRNEASTGGGLMLGSQTTFDAADSEIAHNVGSYGGGVWVDTWARGVVQRCRFEGNGAHLAGGGIGLGSNVGVRVALENLTFSQQWAERGAGVFISSMVDPGSRTVLRHLAFEDNRAVGEHIFWEHHENLTEADQPVCLECEHHPANTSLLVTSAIAYDIVQDGVRVSGSGVHSSSGNLLAPPLTYRALDFYGNLTSLADSSGFVVVTSDTATLRGQTTAVYDTQQGAELSMLTITGEPGQVFNLSFSPSQQQWAALTLQVTLAPCSAGEQYIAEEGAQRCQRCASGFVKFSNSDTALHRAALDCRGGSQFVLQDGYWMPEAWIASRCTTAEGVQSAAEECSAENVLKQVYSCTDKHRCKTSEPRGSAGNLSHLFLMDMCRAGSRADTVLCAGCEPGFFVGVLDLCTECPDATTTLSMATGALLGTVALVFLARAGMRWYYGNTELQARMLAQMRAPERTGILLGVLLGHVQVVAQTLTLFPGEVVPDVYEGFLNSAEPFNLAVMAWIPFSCLNKALGISGRVEVYYWTLAFYASLPVFFCIPIVLSVIRARQLAELAKGEALKPVPQPLSSFSLLGDLMRRASATSDSSVRAADAAARLRRSDASSRRSSGRTLTDVERAAKQAGENEMGKEPLTPRVTVNPIWARCSMRDVTDEVDDTSTTGMWSRMSAATSEDDSSMWAAADEIHAMGRQSRTSAMPSQSGMSDVTDEGVSQNLMVGLAGFALMYLQPACATFMFSHFSCERVESEEGSYWLVIDHQVECYTWKWYIFRTLVISVILVYILGLPLVLAFVPYRLRKTKCMRVKESGATIYVHRNYLVRDLEDEHWGYHMIESSGRRIALEAVSEEVEGQLVPQTALRHPEAKILLDYHLKPFRDRFFFWAAYDMVRKLAQTSVVLLVQEVDDQYDLLYSACLTTIALAIHAQNQPYKLHLVNLAQTIVLVSQTLIISMLMGQRYASSEFGSSVVGTVAVAIQVTLMGALLYIIVTDIIKVNRPTFVYLARLGMGSARSYRAAESLSLRCREEAPVSSHASLGGSKEMGIRKSELEMDTISSPNAKNELEYKFGDGNMA
ncbi:hypothetical protein CYMTET_15410, partial [Cymbomonas tetramitiformis]